MATKPKNKLPMELIEPEHMVALASALATGAEKYGKRGYMEQTEEDMVGALQRHLAHHRMGHTLDDESGLPHTWHVLATAAILVSLGDEDGRSQRHLEPKQEEPDGQGFSRMTKVYTCARCLKACGSVLIAENGDNVCHSCAMLAEDV